MGTYQCTFYIKLAYFICRKHGRCKLQGITSPISSFFPSKNPSGVLIYILDAVWERGQAAREKHRLNKWAEAKYKVCCQERRQSGEARVSATQTESSGGCGCVLGAITGDGVRLWKRFVSLVLVFRRHVLQRRLVKRLDRSCQLLFKKGW